MWEISNSGQLLNIFISFTVGMIFSIIYSFVKAIKEKIKSKTKKEMADILFLVFYSFCNILLLFALTNGMVRYYIFGFQILGFAVANLIFSKFILFIFSKIISYFCLLYRLIFYYLQKISEKTVKNCLKWAFFSKKLLKNIYSLLYTYFCKYKVKKK
ncbi:MAG: hypothetical protein MJ090_04055 [Clostridia bacterium]|nr:hypothetical protein [Clostridia bacterium]